MLRQFSLSIIFQMKKKPQSKRQSFLIVQCTVISKCPSQLKFQDKLIFSRLARLMRV